MDLKRTFTSFAISGAAAATFTAAAATTNEHDVIGDLIQSAGESGYTDIVHDPITPPSSDLYDLIDTNDYFGRQPAFIETVAQPSESGLMDVSLKNFPNVQQFDLSSMYQLCEEHPESCPKPMDGYSVFLVNNPDIIETIYGINHKVNHTYAPKTDMENYGVSDYAQRISIMGSGDCEDYVLEKEAQLIDAGISAGALRKISVMTPEGEGHEVLGVATINGVMLLDNRTDDLVMLQNSEYQVVASTTPQEPWKKSVAVEAAVFDNSFIDFIEAQEKALYAPIDDTKANVPLPRKRPEGFEL